MSEIVTMHDEVQKQEFVGHLQQIFEIPWERALYLAEILDKRIEQLTKAKAKKGQKLVMNLLAKAA